MVDTPQYKSLTEYLTGTWKSFGTNTAGQLVLKQIPSLRASYSPDMGVDAEWREAVKRLNEAARSFTGIDNGLQRTVEVAKETNEIGRQHIRELIEEINNQGMAATDVTQYVHAIMGAFTAVESIVENATGSHVEESDEMEKLRKRIQELEEKYNNSERQRAEAEKQRDAANQRATELESYQNKYLTNPNAVQDVNSRVNALDKALQNLGGGTPITNPGYGASSGMGSDLGSMMSMLEQMNQMKMMRELADSDMADRHQEADRERLENIPGATEPQAVTPPTPAAIPGAPATTAPNASPSTPPSTPATNPAGTSPGTGQQATPAPDADGNLIYTFKDGRTQKVSAIVYQALGAAEGNAAGTSAQQAYANTPAKWEPAKDGKTERPGDPVDPYELMTGDVATWAERSAVIAVFGSDSDGSLEVIVDGVLTPFTAEMHDSHGDFGDFAGFCHPKGIELGTTQPDRPANTVLPGDQPVTAPTAALPA